MHNGERMFKTIQTALHQNKAAIRDGEPRIRSHALDKLDWLIQALRQSTQREMDRAEAKEHEHAA